jgi:hypothetical protein
LTTQRSIYLAPTGLGNVNPRELEGVDWRGRGGYVVAAAPVGERNRQLWESTRNLYNLVATSALDHREVDQGLLDAAERCGLLTEEPRQTRRTLASGRQVGLAHPGRPRQPTSPERTHPSPPAWAAGERTKERR